MVTFSFFTHKFKSNIHLVQLNKQNHIKELLSGFAFTVMATLLRKKNFQLGVILASEGQ